MIYVVWQRLESLFNLQAQAEAPLIWDAIGDKLS